MDGLDFGWEFAVLIIGLAFLGELIKGLFRLLLIYLPAHFFYRRFFKSESVTLNFYRAFFCWTISWVLLNSLTYQLIEWLSMDTLNQICDAMEYNNLHRFHHFFLFFLFWKYDYEKIAARFRVVGELRWKHKIIRYLLFFCLLFIVGFFLQFDSYSYTIFWTKQLTAMSLFLIFIGIINFKITSKPNLL